MYSLSIHFGPNAMVWAFMFKEKEHAHKCFDEAMMMHRDGKPYACTDDFGQYGSMSGINGVMLEDLDLVEEARILRSLANARGEVKARQRASTDPVIRQAQQGPSVLQPNFRQ
jgi:hypothetical protein